MNIASVYGITYYTITPENSNYKKIVSSASSDINLNIHNWAIKASYRTYDYCEPPRHYGNCGNFVYIEEFEFDAPSDMTIFSFRPQYYLANGANMENSGFFLVSASIYNYQSGAYETIYLDEDEKGGWRNEIADVYMNPKLISNNKMRIQIEVRNTDTNHNQDSWTYFFYPDGGIKATFLFSRIMYLYAKVPTCYDGEQNQDETGVDCGGSCEACVSCDNRIKDGDELGVDCGGSCSEQCNKLKILALPLNWGGSQEEFEKNVNTQMDFFINSTELDNCRENVQVDILDVKEQNFDTFSCSRNDCGVDKIKPFVEGLGISVKDYDHIVAFTESSLCSPIMGCSNGNDAAWVTTNYDSIAAHEIGHFYDLEDEYCSNQAGSNDLRCNDGGDWWWKGPIPIPPLDENYLDSELGCNANISDCCSDCSSNGNLYGTGDYFMCCEGNINSKGGRAIMSYADADEPREFDEHSKAHLDSFSKLQCPTAARSRFKMLPAVENKIIDLDMLIYKNDSVEKRWINLVDGKQLINTKMEGSYSLLLKNNNNNTLFNYTFQAFYDYSGPMEKGENYSGINLDSYDLSLKIEYDDEMYKIELWYNEAIIFSEILDFCNQDGICNGSETYLSCWQDCRAWSADGLCINNLDGNCDPDCAEGVDLDCKQKVNLNLVKGWNLVSLPLNLSNKSLSNLLSGINYSKIFIYNKGYIELNENDTIDERYGAWILMLNDSEIEINDYIFNNLTYNLSKGYNLIGYPSMKELDTNYMFTNVSDNINNIFTYSNKTWYSYIFNRTINSLTTLNPGKALWIDVKNDGVWEFKARDDNYFIKIN